MPSRLAVACIALFWVGTVAWLFFRDILPRLESTEPVFFVVDKEAELPIGTDVHSAARWKVTRNDLDDYRLETSVTYSRHEDMFDFHGNLTLLRKPPHAGTIGEQMPVDILNGMATSVYSVEQTGRLVSLRLSTQYSLAVPPAGGKHSLDVRVGLFGRPEEGRFGPTAQIRLGRRSNIKTIELESVNVSRQGFILNPLHPLDKVKEIHGGQSWDGGVIDPFCLGLLSAVAGEKEAGAALPDLQGTSKPLQVLHARVLPDEVDLIWIEGQRVPCWQMEYGGADAPMWITIWVRSSDGLVLKQESKLLQRQQTEPDTWLFEREAEP